MALLCVTYAAVVASLTLLGQTVTLDRVKSIKVVGGTAYTADGSSGLAAVDVRNPMEMTILWNLAMGDARGVEVAGSTIYVADAITGLQVVQAGSVVGRYSDPCSEVYLSAGIAYVRSLEGVILALDVADPTTPKLLGSYNFNASKNLFVVDTTVYSLGGSPLDLQIIDFSTPSDPVLLGSLGIDKFTATSFRVSGNTAYVGTYSSFLIFDVTDPSAPSFTAEYSEGGNAIFVIVDNTVYLANQRFRIIDVSTDTPLLVGLANRPSTRRGFVQVEGTTAYIAGFGIQVFDVANASNPMLLGDFNRPGGAHDVAVSGDYAYIAGGALLQVVDIKNPAAPSVVGFYSKFEGRNEILGRAVQVVGNIVYVGTCESFYIFDVSTPSQPRLLGEFNPGSFACSDSVQIIGTIAYVGFNSHNVTISGLHVLDVSKPQEITVIGVHRTQIGVVSVSGTVAYTVNMFEGLILIDVGNTSAPTRIGTLKTPGRAETLTASGTTVYLGGSSGLFVIDASTPSAPVIVGSVESDDFRDVIQDVVVVGDIVVASGTKGVQVINVSNSSAPQVLEKYPTSSHVLSIAVVGNLAYLAQDGMLVLKLWENSPHTPSPVGTTAPGDNADDGYAMIFLIIGVSAALGLTVGIVVFKWQVRRNEREDAVGQDTEMHDPQICAPARDVV